MRIATVCFSSTVGGLELATLRRGADLAARGHDVISVLPDSPGLLDHARMLGLRSFVVTPGWKYVDLRGAVQLRKLLRERRVELLLVGRSHDLSTVLMAADRNVAVVLYQQMQSGIDKRDWFHNRMYRRLDGAVAITRQVGGELARNTVLDPRKISVVEYGIDAERFSPDAIARSDARALFGLPDDAFVVGIVGGFNPGKGQRDFIEALALAAEGDSDLASRMHGLLVGERAGDRSEYTEGLRRLRDGLPIGPRLHFHPFLSDPRAAYAALDLFVLASHSETFGMVLQEALAMGIPSIGTESGGVPEIITHEHTGLLVPPRDPGAIAEAIVRLYRDPWLRRQLAEAAREFVLRAYDPGRQLAAFEGALIAAYNRRQSA